MMSDPTGSYQPGIATQSDRVVDLAGLGAADAPPHEPPAESSSAAGDLADVLSHALLERLAVALNSLQELRSVALLLAEATRDAVAADRCTLLVVEGRRLRPVATRMSGGEQPAILLPGLDMVELDEDYWEPFCAGRALFIEDAASAGLVPPAWVTQFGLASLVLVPLVATGEPVGLLVVEWGRTKPFDRREVRLLETIGSMAAVAVRNLRMLKRFERRAELHEALAEAAASLAYPVAPDVIAQRLADAYTELLHARLCAIALVDDDQAAMTTVATRNIRQVQPMPLDEIPKELLVGIGKTWEQDKRPIEFGDDPWLAEVLGSEEAGASWYLVVPLLLEGHTRGAALLGFDAGTRLDDEERRAASALGSIVAAALERHELLERLAGKIGQLDALYRLSTHVSQAPDVDSLLAALNETLTPHGVEVTGLALRDPRLSRPLGGARPTRQEREAWRGKPGYAILPHDQLAVPMWLDGRVMGSLRVRPAGIDDDARHFLEALAQGLAEIANRGALRAEVEEANRERALELERARIASDVHDSTGQLFIALGLIARQLMTRFEPGSDEALEALRMAELAERGKANTNEAIRAGTFLPAPNRALVAALHGLIESFERDSGIVVLLDVDGEEIRLPTTVERALYRVAHEALTNAWRHARCSVVWVELRTDEHEVVLSIRDDGLGLRTNGNDDYLHYGVAGMERAMLDIGGTFELANAGDGGAQVRASVPR